VIRLLVKILLPVLVIAGASAVAFVTVANRSEPARRPPRVAVTEVEFVPVEAGRYTVRIATRGTVRPRTESTLIPEISGRVVERASKLRTGAFFEQGDVLLRIDDRDYRAAVTVARAALAQARATLAEEKARADQARRDWRRLGATGEPDALVLRAPQLAGARAAVASAQARLEKAKIDVERTTIRAPYAGRVLEQVVDVGQYVSPGTVLARVYAVDYVEVRLPLSNRQLEFVDVPETYRGDAADLARRGPPVRFTARIGSKRYSWEGRIVRAEGSIDTKSRQLFVVGQVDDPYGKGPAGRPPLKVGQFVEAEIRGRTLDGVFVIPRSALRAGREVLLVDPDNRLRTRAVEPVWRDATNAVVARGLTAGERLVVTPLGAGMDGVEVRPRLAGAAAKGKWEAPGRGSGPRLEGKTGHHRGEPRQRRGAAVTAPRPVPSPRTAGAAS